MAVINGMFERHVIHDTKGRTDNVLAGVGNTAMFVGDHGANNFSIGGYMSNGDVRNLGRDDHVYLQGPGWRELPDANSRDGVVRYYNDITKSYAEVHTDAGRNDNFVRQRVLGANQSCQCNDWGSLGQMNYAYNQGYEDGFRAGRSQGRFEGSFFTALALGPLAWFC